MTTNPVVALAMAAAVALTASASAAELAKSPFPVPTPAKTEHPGAAAAPASSPTTYQDEAGFQKRVGILIEGLSANNFKSWRTGYFTGGDPGKYTFGTAMARLLKDPQDAETLKIQNEPRSLKEQYHFACVNWSRFLPIFGETITPESRQILDQAVTKYNFLNQGGTENHKTMWMTSANVLPYYTESGRLNHLGKDQALARAKAQLREYVKGLYAGGQGEWDSSTYLMFDVNGMLNIYDFSKDEEARLLAKAALDWYTTAYALKYVDGLYCSPNQRGFAEGPVKKIADNSGWLWWGSNREMTAPDTRGFHWAMHAATSAWRPNAVITNIATRNLPQLPFESRNSKPNYWGISGSPKANQMQEQLFVSRHYTMGSMWKGFGGQMTRFQIAATTPTGAVQWTGASPIGRNDGNGALQFNKFEDGNGMFDQSAQVGRAFVLMTDLPDAKRMEELAKSWASRQANASPASIDKTVGEWVNRLSENTFVFFSIPEGVTPVAAGKWTIMQAGETLVAVQPIHAQATLTTTTPDKNGKSDRYLKLDGRRAGFVVETADTGMYKTPQAFGEALNANTKLDASRFPTDLVIAYTTLAGKKVDMQYHEGGRANVAVDGQKIDFNDWPVYENPYVQHKAGVLSVNDGKDGFVVDFTGELPVYKPWKK